MRSHWLEVHKEIPDLARELGIVLSIRIDDGIPAVDVDVETMNILLGVVAIIVVANHHTTVCGDDREDNAGIVPSSLKGVRDEAAGLGSVAHAVVLLEV